MIKKPKLSMIMKPKSKFYKLAEEIRKMEDSNGYLKKMYEEKINNYERVIK